MMPYTVDELRYMKLAIGKMPVSVQATVLVAKLNLDIRREQSRETLNHPHTPDHRKPKYDAGI